MQSMAVKHSTRRWNLKKHAKGVFFKAHLQYFGPEVFEPTPWVQHPLDSDQKCLFIIHVRSDANGPCEAHARHPNCRKGGMFGLFLTDFET